VLPISDKTVEFSAEVTQVLAEAGLRVSMDRTSDKIGAKIRNARLERIPYMLIIGQKELEEGLVSVRHRDQDDLGAMPLAEFVEKLSKENRERSLSFS
jgi:threonyl-tRNA synthetase